MLARLTGTLESIDGSTALVATQFGVAFELLLPGFASQRLSLHIGQTVTFYTMAYLDSPNQGQSFVPRLIGFPAREDRAFFELLTSVKGMGVRKGLRAFAMDARAIAESIAAKDAKMLQALPEIGKKMSETIILELHDKVTPFLGESQMVEAVIAKAGKGAGKGTPVSVNSESSVRYSLVKQAVDALVVLGEDRLRASQWVEQVLSQDNPPTDVSALLSEIYRLRQS